MVVVTVLGCWGARADALCPVHFHHNVVILLLVRSDSTLVASLFFFLFFWCPHRTDVDSLRLSSPPSVILYVTFNPTSLWANSSGCWEKSSTGETRQTPFCVFPMKVTFSLWGILEKKWLHCFERPSWDRGVPSSIPTDQFGLNLHSQSVTTSTWWHCLHGVLRQISSCPVIKKQSSKSVMWQHSWATCLHVQYVDWIKSVAMSPPLNQL